MLVRVVGFPLRHGARKLLGEVALKLRFEGEHACLIFIDVGKSRSTLTLLNGL